MASRSNSIDELWRLSAADSALGLQQGDFSALELMDSILTRMEERNPGINAVVVDLGESAREAAEQADQSRKQGDRLGPLQNGRFESCESMNLYPPISFQRALGFGEYT